MPIFTYMPDWDVIADFYDKCERELPKDYTGKLGIRLHRTGMPLTLELFGSSLPDKVLFPMILVELQDGEMTQDWEQVEYDFDVPWVKKADSDAYRNDVMLFYHTEDILEPEAEKILGDEPVKPEDIRKVIVDHAGVPAEA